MLPVKGLAAQEAIKIPIEVWLIKSIKNYFDVVSIFDCFSLDFLPLPFPLSEPLPDVLFFLPLLLSVIEECEPPLPLDLL